MKRKTRIRILTVLCLLTVAGAWLFWSNDRQKTTANRNGSGGSNAVAAKNSATPVAGAAAAASPAKAHVSTLNTNRLAYRLSNTTNTLKQLQPKPHAILLDNALIDTDQKLDLKIPAHLRSSGDPGAYIVQARGVPDARFRDLLLAAGAQLGNYIPNNAYLVNLPASVAGQLAHNPLVQAVLPYEPYYKLQSPLLGLAVNDEPLPPGTALTLGLFAADAATAEQSLENLGARIIGRDQSPFGPVVRVLAPTDWTTLVQSPVVQYAEPAHVRVPANDLSRVTLGISPDTTSPITNGYAVNGIVLTGNKVLVAVNDSGVDTNHPDFSVSGTAEAPGTVPPSRVTGLTYLDMVDTNGHGTFVAGVIAGNGSMSFSPTNVGTYAEGSVPNADFRGKAPLANLFSMNLENYTDYQLQTNAATVGALISNNSWDYGNGDAEYDLAAASYDFATRDAQPGLTGSQPVLFVFAAGNDGNGDNNGAEGTGDTILSPGTAKNVVTVGALAQLRNITNIVTLSVTGTGTNAVSNNVAYWQPWTESSVQVAWYSARGNVGIGTEGNFGRFKPDVVAPGTFVVSTSSLFNDQWATNVYYNPTNDAETPYMYQVVASNGLANYSVQVPANAVAVEITVSANNLSPNPFPDLPIYCQQSDYPDPVNNPGAIDITSWSNSVSIPPGGGNCTIPVLTANGGSGFYFAVGNTNNSAVNYNVTVDVYTTNDLGNLDQVLEGMNDDLGNYYRYETGTSMAAAGVSGVLALIQDYFTNQFQPQFMPSPALLKALLINGCRSVGDYSLGFTNALNFVGWGLENIGSCVPPNGLFNTPDGSTMGSSFFVDQNPTNALATGDSHTYIMALNTNAFANYLQLQATLVWTDPPGDPAAAIKLVNNLGLVITNLDTGDVYFGNDISSIGYNLPWDTNGPPNIDTINNVQNILLPPLLAGNYSVTVVGRSVNVNAVTAQTNNASGQYAPNIVQDYALVVSLGEGELPDAFTVADSGIVSNPTEDQNFTVIVTTNTPLEDQMVGASSPELGTNMVPLGTNTIWGPNGVVTIGQTNQWHFYVVTNDGTAADFTNAAFFTYDVSTLSIPRMGVYQDNDNVANATTPEANLDMFVTQDSSLTNLSPVAISNCLAGVGNSRAAVANAGTQFVFYTNSAPGQVYYVGIQSEDQMAAEYSFLAVFTSTPFSQLDQNGNQVVNGLLLPMPTPIGNNAHPGVTNVFAIATIPMTVEQVTVTNLIQHQNFGDLVGQLNFSGQRVILNNHDGFGNTIGNAPIVYDDTPDRPLGTTNSDGPGSLVNFRNLSAQGPWILNVLDNSAGGFTGQISRLTLVIQPHRNLLGPGFIGVVPPGGWFVDYVDVPAGYTNLTFYGTNVTVSPALPALQMYEKYGNEPTLTNYDQEVGLTNGTPPGNTISIGPPLAQGTYFVGIYNPSAVSQTFYIRATLGINSAVNDVFDYVATSGQVLLDDAVTPVWGPDPSVPPTAASTSGSVITVPSTVTNLIATVNVGMVIDSPRISDYAFTLVSPTGQRVLLMENRGGNGTNGAGEVFVYTNVLNTTATGGAAANTNYLAVSPGGSIVPITWNFYTVPDQMTVYGTTNAALFTTNGGYYPANYLLYNTQLTNNPPTGTGGAQNTIPFTELLSVPPGISNLTIIMNQFGNPDAAGGDAWFYTAGAANTNYEYLEFTDDTNLASVPIKFAEPPFDFSQLSTNITLSDFDQSVPTNYFGPTNIADGFGTGWTVPTNLVTVTTVETNAQFVLVTNVVLLTNNLVSVVTDPGTAVGGDAGSSNYLALAYGTITRSIPTIPGHNYNVTFWFRGPDIKGWWRGEGNGSDSSDPENNNNNGTLIGRFDYPEGEVGQAFEFEDPGNPYQFAGTNTYVQVPASPSLNVGTGGGLTVEGWINPTNLLRPQPLVEWLAQVPTNPATADTNLVIVQGPVLDQGNGNYYYLLAATNWLTSELWAEQLGGHLVTVTTANLDNWVYDTFTAYGTTNRDLWTGLAYTNSNGTFGWTSGDTNLIYTNWVPGQPAGCGASNQYYAAIMGPTNLFPGLWQLQDNQGLTCDGPPTNPIYGVVEVSTIPTNGVQFWISGTNWTPGMTNYMQGSLYANIVDTNYVSHEIWSAPDLLTTNVYQHVALTFDISSGVAALYLNGTNVATSNLYTAGGSFVPFVPKTDGDLLLGWDMSLYTNNYFAGEMDEMSLYGRALSLAEITGIYQVSADTTNRLVGKFDPTVTPATGLAEALVTFGSISNVIYGVNDQWELNSFTFSATSNSMPLTITGIEPGILLDAFSLEEAPATNLYYFPEQMLSTLNGTPADGNWTLQVWDSRAGAYVTNMNQLVNWQLSFVLVSNAVISASLPPEAPVTTTVSSGQTVFYAVTVPAWAHEATNVLVSANVPVNLVFYNTNNYPGNGNPPDATLLTSQTSGPSLPPMATNAVLPQLRLEPGTTYYLGVINSNAISATVQLAVDYDILSLTNGVPFTDVLTNEYSSVRYFTYNVSSNAYEATFQLLQLNGNADLVLSQGAPLPSLNSDDYGSFNNGTVDENIYVFTNSEPVALSPGAWYLGVVNRDGLPITYSVVAKELDLTNLDLPIGPMPVNLASGTMPVIINLTNGVPYTGTAGPGAALTNFFHLVVTNSIVNGTNIFVPGLRFELYNLTGNGDLTVQTNALPLAPPFFQSSQNPGTTPELILIYTNNVLTNLAADWYLGVPNLEVSNISYTIVAWIETNAYFPAFPSAEGAGGAAVGGGHAGQTNGTVYHVTTTADSIPPIPSSLRAAVANSNCTVVFDIGGNINLASPLVITNSNLTIAGQTSPGGGITVVGNMTMVTNAHDVIIRDVRFRTSGATNGDSLQFLNVSNVIADHISAEWSASNLVSVLNSTNVTVQWSMLADSLYTTNLSNTNTPAGSRLREGAGALTFHHNLYADNYIGSPRLGDNLTLDFVNNVIYNWGLFAGLTGGTNDLNDFSPNGCTNMLNYVGNYLIAGPDTAGFATNYAITNIAFFAGGTNALAANWIFQTNNFIDSDTNGILNGSDTGWRMFTNAYTRFTHAFTIPPVSVDEAYQAYEKVLDFAGVDLNLRDSVDTNIATKVRYQTGTLIGPVPTLTVPGIVAWWKGEGNALDSVGMNNGVTQNITYGPGEVGQAFYSSGFSGPTPAWVHVPASPSLNVGATGNGFTLEAWVNPVAITLGNQQSIFQWSTNTVGGPFGVYFEVPAGPSYPNPNGLHFDVVDTTGANHDLYTPGTPILGDTFQHVAATYDPTTGNAVIYCDGAQVAAGNVGTGYTPQTSMDFFLAANPTRPDWFQGAIDEATIYDRVLAPAEIQAIYKAGSLGKSLSGYSPVSPLPYLDTDQDGLPDFWENTFTPGLVYTNSNNHARTGTGYTDIEEYNNWLAGPHALTTATNPVAVDLYQLCGESGQMAFFVTNGVQGFVYLTNVIGSVTNTSTVWSNTIAVFTPTNNLGSATNYSGYASFDFYVTNLDTYAYFGPVTVSVFVSAVPITINSNIPPVITPLTSGVSSDPTNYGGSQFFSVQVSSNNVGALFELDNPTGPMAMVISISNGISSLPSLSSYDYYTNQPPAPAKLQIAVLTNSTPVPLQAGTWYMAAVNESGSNVIYTAKITLLGGIVPPQFLYPANGFVTNILETAPWQVTCLATDLDTPPLPLTFGLVSGPTNLTVSSVGVIAWTPTEEQGGTANTVEVSVSNGAFSVTNTFTINVEYSNQPPVLPVIPNQLVIEPGGQLVVTNTATNPNLPAYPLSYVLSSTVTGPDQPIISANGIITWTPTPGQAGSNYLLTTVVTDNDPPAVNATSLSATNSFYVAVLPGLAPGGPTNIYLGPGYTIWFAIPVPTNAIYATNTLIYATLPINLWFSTNLLLSITNGDSTELLNNATNGVSVLSANPATAPTNIVPGGYYLLGVQNTNLVPVSGAIEINFAYSLAPILTPGQPGTNVVAPNSINWFELDVPANADLATNSLLYATAPVNLWYSTNAPPTITNAADAELLANATSGSAVLNTNSAPLLVPGSSYYLGVQNTNDFAVTNAVEVTFHLVSLTPQKFSLFSIIETNRAGTNGFLITWFALTNDQFHLQWTRALAPRIWSNFNGVISDSSSVNPTNGQFQYFDDGSQTAGFSLTRFYRLLLVNSPSNTPPFFLYVPGSYDASPSVPFLYTNTARDWDVPAQTLTYSVQNSLDATNVTINPATGLITWTPTLAQLGASNIITTIVTDNGVPPKSSTNSFLVVVPPAFSSITVAANGVTFKWTALTNDEFQIRWTTNLAPAVWNVFPYTNTSLTGNFIYVDTNLPLVMMKFYQLILLP